MDSGGDRTDAFEIAAATDAWVSMTCKPFSNVRAVIERTVWADANGAEAERGTQVAETTFSFGGHQLRMIIRRQPAGSAAGCPRTRTGS